VAEGNDQPIISNYRLRQLRRAIAREGRVDKALEEEIMALSEDQRVQVFRAESRCRVCNAEAAPLVNRMLSHAMTYQDVLDALEPLNNTLPDDRKITYKALWNHAQRHFPIENAAASIYRKMVEKRAEEMQKDFVNGVGGFITLAGYLEVLRQKGFETLVDENTKVSVETGMRAAEKLHQLEEGGDKDAKLAQAMVNIDRIIDAVRAVVPQEQWHRIVDHLDGGSPLAIDAEVVDIQDDFDDAGEYLNVDTDPEAED
jgi:hypothetical protein